MSRHGWTRRRFAAALAAAAGAPPSQIMARAGVEASEPLRLAAAAGGLTFGCAGGESLFTDGAYRELFLAQAALLTPENALKFDRLRPAPGRFDYARADALVDWARAQGLAVHGHTLIWNDRLPPWVGALTKAEAVRCFDQHIDEVVTHFAGRVASWDVVNEPSYLGGDHPGTLRPGPWLDALGPGYIVRAFRRAAAVGAGARLVLNEAWTERADAIGAAVRQRLLRLVDDLQHAGIRLDAAGLQGHLLPGVPHDDAAFGDFLHRLAERGVAIRISEFDVNDDAFRGDERERDRAVADRTAGFLRAVLAVPAVEAVVCWGLADRYSWWRDPAVMAARGATRLPRPLPYDEMLQRKPMAGAMAAAFRERRRSARAGRQP